MLSRHLAAGAIIAAAPLLLLGCGAAQDAAPAAGSAAVAVAAKDDRCDLDRTDLQPGTTTFKVTNQGSQVTEVYVYGAADGAYTKIVGEVENIGPGLSRELTAELAPGTYEVACKPGQTGSGIRTRVTVAGATASATAAEEEAGYDRELELASDGRSISGDLRGLRRGQKVEFKLANRSNRELVLELKDPQGAVAGETEPIPAKSTGETIIELMSGGTWTVVVESEGREDVVRPLMVS